MSVPDADTLIRLAEILEVYVSELLGTKIENENVASDVAEQLSRINEQLAIKNRRSRRIWKIVAIILAVIVLVNIFIAVFFRVPEHGGAFMFRKADGHHLGHSAFMGSSKISVRLYFVENDDSI